MNTRINLQPIAAPSILGLYAFAGSTLIVAANMAGWYGNSETALYLIPFTTVFGGIAQFAAGHDLGRPEGSDGRHRRGRAGFEEGTVRDCEQGCILRYMRV